MASKDNIFNMCITHCQNIFYKAYMYLNSGKYEWLMQNFLGQAELYQFDSLRQKLWNDRNASEHFPVVECLSSQEQE